MAILAVLLQDFKRPEVDHDESKVSLLPSPFCYLIAHNDVIIRNKQAKFDVSVLRCELEAFGDEVTLQHGCNRLSFRRKIATRVPLLSKTHKISTTTNSGNIIIEIS